MSRIGDLMNAHGETMAHAKKGIVPDSGGKIQAFNARRAGYKSRPANPVQSPFTRFIKPR